MLTFFFWYFFVVLLLEIFSTSEALRSAISFSLLSVFFCVFASFGLFEGDFDGFEVLGSSIDFISDCSSSFNLASFCFFVFFSLSTYFSFSLAFSFSFSLLFNLSALEAEVFSWSFLVADDLVSLDPSSL